jgi:hypothetical protein
MAARTVVKTKFRGSEKVLDDIKELKYQMRLGTAKIKFLQEELRYACEREGKPVPIQESRKSKIDTSQQPIE